MRPTTLYIVGFFICLLPARLSYAQTGHTRGAKGASAAQIVVKATVDKQQILIGQPIQLMLEATVSTVAQPGAGGVGGTSASQGLVWPALDSLPHFDWVEKGKVDSVVRPDGLYYRQYTTITSFDSGSWSIPRLPFMVGNKKVFSDSVRIEVGYTKIDPSKDYHDIKDIIDVPNPLAKWIPWIVAGVVLISLAGVIWLVQKKKRLKMPEVPIPVVRLSPYEEATRQLEELERQRLPENGAVKTYYTRLGEIFRVYLYRRLGISSPAETSEELIGQLRKVQAIKEHFVEVSETLRMGDFVKFAKYQPGIADCDHHLSVIRSTIDVLEKVIQEENMESAVADGQQTVKNSKQ